MLDDDPQQGVMILRALARQTAINLQAAQGKLAEQIESETPDPDVEEMVARAVAAQQEFEGWDEERVDALLGTWRRRSPARPRSWPRRTVEPRRTSATRPTRC